MKKFVISVFMVTLISALYVFQHTKLLECSYDINSHQEYIALLIDQNRNLRYNIAKLEAPARLEETVLAKDTEFYMPQSWYKIKVDEEIQVPKEVNAAAGGYNRMGRIILSMFSFGSEAVANDSR